MRHRIALSSALAAACAAAAPASIARAQTSAAAELAFREGRQLMNQGRYQEACPKFEESQRLDPAPGTQLNLADCYEKQGRTASAWETFRAAEAAAHDSGQPDFASEARRRAVALEPRLCKLALSAAQPVAGLEVALDGEPVTELIGSAVPVDPGEHAVTASAPARRPWSQRVRIDAPGTTVAVAIPALPAIAAGDRAPPRAEARARRPRTGGGGGRRMTPLSWGLAVGAGAALAVGVGLDIAAYRDLSDCRDRGGCGSQGELDSIENRFLIGDVLLGAAVAGAGAAVLVYWLGGDESDRSVDLVAAPGAAAVRVSGRF